MIQISSTAASEIKRLQAKRNSHLFFRLQVKQGGCSGLVYDLKFDQEVRQGDRLYECADISVVIDAQSLNYINQLTLDYSEDLMGGGFRFHNSSAITTCGCGNSFSTSSDCA